jgi:hypothetical protein
MVGKKKYIVINNRMTTGRIESKKYLYMHIIYIYCKLSTENTQR